MISSMIKPAFLWRIIISLLLFVPAGAEAQNNLPPPPGLGDTSDLKTILGGDNGASDDDILEIIDRFNHENQDSYGYTAISKYFLKSGVAYASFNFVQLNSNLWRALSTNEQDELGGQLAKDLQGTGMVSCRIIVEGIEVGKLKPSVSKGLKYEPGSRAADRCKTLVRGFESGAASTKWVF